MAETKEWNPRYILYARVHGKSPEEMLRYDGNTMEFSFWIQERWREWRALFVGPMYGWKADEAWLNPQAHFDKWLEERCPAQ